MDKKLLPIKKFIGLQDIKLLYYKKIYYFCALKELFIGILEYLYSPQEKLSI